MTTKPDAYLLQGDWDDPIIDSYDYAHTYDREHTYDAVPLELVRSFDHGIRTAEDLLVSIIIETTDYVMLPLMRLAGLHPAADLAAYAFNYCQDEYGIVVRHGMYSLPDDYNPMTSDRDLFAELVDHAEESEQMLSDAGYIVETSADAGMTWIYRPITD